MVLVTGAAGKTGLAVVRAVTNKGTAVRAFIRRESQRAVVRAAGAAEVYIGQMGAAGDWQMAMTGIAAVYLICPNVNPIELHFSELAIEAAKMAGEPHVVYHSVLHPQIEAMPHHWQKMRVEERLFASGLPFTILQPTAYMQNFMAGWTAVLEEGVYRVPYSPQTRLSLVDLEDVAETAARVLNNPGHVGSIYELAGTRPLSQVQVAEIVSGKLQRPIRVEEVALETWRRQAAENGLGRYQIETLIQMFKYYDAHGLVGNPTVLGWLLERPPTTFDEFLDRVIQQRFEN